MRYQCKECTKLKHKEYRSISHNRERATNRSRRWYAENTERAKKRAKEKFDLIKYRDREFRRKYGISIADYNLLVEQQEARCKICTDNSTQLVVDHNHKTGDVRGLLCVTCNSGLGMFHDSRELLVAAAGYLERSNGEF